MEESRQILLPCEIESYLEDLQISHLPCIGSSKWFQQSEKLRKLSLQAIFDVKSEKEEVVKEYLVTLQKVSFLIHELITTEVWRLKVFPLLVQMDLIKSYIPIYMVIYHEVSIVSFLEAVLFHEEVIESAADLLIDLVDYCYRQIILLDSLQTKAVQKSSADAEDPTDKEQLEKQRKQIAFETGIKSISILSFITQHIKIVPLCVLHRILITHDVPLLFTNLITKPPWERKQGEETQKYCDGKWKKVDHRDILVLNKVEGQIWIALIQLLLNPDCQKKYDMNGYKKDQLLKLRSKLNDVTIDQIPILKELLRYLEHLSLFDAPVPKPGVIVEQIPEIWEYLQTEHKKKWKEIAGKQMKDYFSLSDYQLQSFCTKLTDSFDLTNIEAMLSDKPVCAQCGGEGLKRCSRCKNEWYCKRPCQVTHWPKHRTACDLMAK